MTDAASRQALFISHATPGDNHFVSWLGAKLAAMGYEVWADVMQLRGGSDWARELERALRQRAVKMLLVCTPEGLEKQGVRNEIEIGAQLARTLNDPEFIIPLRLQNYDAPFRIAQSQYVDFKSSWARGLSELVELLATHNVTKRAGQPMEAWLASHAIGSTFLAEKSEPLLSNWLQISSQPPRICYCEPPVGSPLDRFQNRASHKWPVVPHRGGVVSFAGPDADGCMSADLPGKLVHELSTADFLNIGWASLGIEAFQARRMFSDLGAQAFDNYAASRSLKSYAGSGRRLSWWGDIKTMPTGQVRFDWGFQRGARQIVGHSEKRHVHWHYAINAQLRTGPLPHIRLAARLVFSQNGLDAIGDAKKAHVLRRSMAKGWRNARWRDMLCAYIWWLVDGKSELRLPVAPGENISAHVPPMSFGCPVSVIKADSEALDEDDPDVPEEDWNETVGVGAEE